MKSKSALILRAETHEFELQQGRLVPLAVPLAVPQVVLVYEVLESGPKHRCVFFPVPLWEELNLPEPEDFVGHRLSLGGVTELTAGTLVAYWKMEAARKYQPVLAVDFDGVIAEYSGWKGSKHFGEPLPGVVESLTKLKEAGHWICIWTTREPVGVQHYCTTRGIPVDSINSVMFRPWARKKVCANVFLDDRGMKFPGKWSDELVTEILDFHPWWEDERDPEDFTEVKE